MLSEFSCTESYVVANRATSKFTSITFAANMYSPSKILVIGYASGQRLKFFSKSRFSALLEINP